VKARITLTVWSPLKPLSSFLSALSASWSASRRKATERVRIFSIRLKRFDAFLFANFVAQNTPEQAYVFQEGAFVVFAAFGGLGGGRGFHGAHASIEDHFWITKRVTVDRIFMTALTH
jgi:hypothetical protein